MNRMGVENFLVNAWNFSVLEGEEITKELSHKWCVCWKEGEGFNDKLAGTKMTVCTF